MRSITLLSLLIFRSNVKLEELTINLKDGIREIQGKIAETTSQIQDLKTQINIRDEKLIEQHDEKVAFQRKVINNRSIMVL